MEGRAGIRAEQWRYILGSLFLFRLWRPALYVLPLWADGDRKRDGCMSEMEADRVACNDLGMRIKKKQERRETEKSSRIKYKKKTFKGRRVLYPLDMTTKSIGLLIRVQYITRKTTDCLKARLLKERTRSSFYNREVEFKNNNKNLLDSTHSGVLLLQPKYSVYSRCMKTVDVSLYFFYLSGPNAWRCFSSTGFFLPRTL